MSPISYKRENVSDELAFNMQNHYKKNDVNKKFGIEKLDRALEYLSSASEIFDDIGLTKEAIATLNILQSFSSKDAGSKDAAKDRKEPWDDDKDKQQDEEDIYDIDQEFFFKKNMDRK